MIFITITLKKYPNDNIAVKNTNLQQTTTINLQMYTLRFSLDVFIKKQISFYTFFLTWIFFYSLKQYNTIQYENFK